MYFTFIDATHLRNTYLKGLELKKIVALYSISKLSHYHFEHGISSDVSTNNEQDEETNKEPRD